VKYKGLFGFGSKSLFLASVFAFLVFFAPPAHANIFSDLANIITGSTQGDTKNMALSDAYRGAEGMALAEAPLNHELSQSDDDVSPIVVSEGSALSAGLSASPAPSSENKNNGSSEQISVYVVREGDTLSQIAKMFDVSPNTILWANDIPKGKSLKIGQKLVILPVSGIQYTVKKGDTLAKIAKKYSGDREEILDFNDLKDGQLVPGDDIIIPNGTEPVNPIIAPIKKIIRDFVPNIQTNGYFTRPALGVITQEIHGHNGVDFSGRGGSNVYAAAGGTVLISLSAGYNGGYGHYIVINHPNGMQTLYSHLSANFVSPGDTVTRGQVIGQIGNTGRSTGPHLHFEVHGGINPF